MGKQEDESRYLDKLELVYQAYEKSLDLDIACVIVLLSNEERDRILADPDFRARIAICDARIREDIIHDFRGISKDADSDATRLSALKELGKMLYPTRFKVLDAPLTQPLFALPDLSSLSQEEQDILLRAVTKGLSGK